MAIGGDYPVDDGEDNVPDYGDLTPIPRYESRCHVCTSEHRKAIDRLVIMPNISYTELSEMFGIDRRSIANHAKKHLNYEEAAIKKIIETEAAALQVDFEEGVKGALSRRVFLSAYIQRVTESLLNGTLELTGKDAMKAIEMMERVDNATGGAAVDEIRMQFNAMVQAIREISERDLEMIKNQPAALQLLILNRTKELLASEEQQKQLEK